MNTYRLTVFLLSALLLIQPAAAALRVVSTFVQPPGQPERSYRFPLVQGDDAASRRVAQNINLQLQLTTFGGYDEEGRLAALFTPATPPAFLSTDYRIVYQSAHLLTLSVYMKWAPMPNDFDPGSATREQVAIHNYVFDLSSGTLVTPHDLLTPEGINKLNDDLMQRRSAAYDRLIASLQQQAARSAASQALTRQWIDWYQDEKLWGVEEAGGTIGLVSNEALQIVQDAFIMQGNSTLRGQEMKHGQDVRDIWFNHFPLRSLSGRLSHYGRCILSDAPALCQRKINAIQPGIWRGEYLGAPLRLVITRYNPHYMDGMGNSVEGYILWDHHPPAAVHSQGVPSFNAKNLYAEEMSDADRQRPMFRGEFVFAASDGTKQRLNLTLLHNGHWQGIDDQGRYLAPDLAPE